MTHTISLFLKFGKEAHIRDLYENGTVYINTLKHFRKTEDGSLRGDKYEGAVRYTVPPKDAIITMTMSDGLVLHPTKIEYGQYLERGNLYSLYCISSHGFELPEDFALDKRNLDFGTHCLVITKPGVFIERMEAALEALQLEYDHNFVTYYKVGIENKNLNPFQKPDVFVYQKEFRFHVNYPKDKALTVKLGSLSDIAQIIDSDNALEIKLSSNIHT